MPPLLLHSILQPRALGSEDTTYEGPSSTEETGKQGTKIGAILGCVFVVTLGTVFAIVGLLVRRKRRRDAARGTRIHDLQSEELVPWLTRGSQGPNSHHYDPLLPSSTPGSAPSELPPSPGYSRLPMNGHHSAEASQSSMMSVIETGQVDGGTEGEGRVEEGRTPARQATGDSTRSLPPPYSSGTSGVGTDLSRS